MRAARDYRGFADALRREARATALPKVREMRLSAADRWEQFADEAELFERRAKPQAALPELIG